MPVFPYTGPSYTYLSRNFDCQRSVNQFRIQSETKTSKQMFAMVGSPGTQLFSNTGPDGVRGAWEFNNSRAFFVAGLHLYEVLSDGTKVNKGTLLTQYGNVGVTDNGFQICVVDGSYGYILQLAQNIELVTNGTFASDTSWTKGVGWTIAAGHATATGAISTNLSQVITLIQGVSYRITYTVTRSAGSITPKLGGTSGVTRSAAGAYTENITAGSDGTGLVFVAAGFTGTIDTVSVQLITDQFIQITDPYFLGADTVTYQGGYFIFNKPDSGIYYLSNLYDGLHGDPLMFATAESATDNLVAVQEVHNQLWLFGHESIQVQYNSGDTFPFTNISGAFIEYGTAAAFSITPVANTVIWLGLDNEGAGVVFMANGYQPQRISTGAVEEAIQGYGDLTNAKGFVYQEAGQYFYVLNIPGANTSWVFNISMQEWHERAYWNQDQGIYERDRPQCHLFCFGKHLVGDYANGNVYEQALDIYSHDGTEIRRLRSAPHIADDLEYIYHKKFQLDMQEGTGLESGSSEDINPQIMLRWSDDGGYTWSNEHWRETGKVGQYNKRVIWRRLGRSRDRVYETVFTAKCRFFVIAAHLEVAKGLN